MIYTILIIVLSVAADQLTKYLAVTHLAGRESFQRGILQQASALVGQNAADGLQQGGFSAAPGAGNGQMPFTAFQERIPNTICC